MVERIECPNCKVPLNRSRIEEWSTGNILLKQLQKIVDNAGISIFHCKQCGKIEIYKTPK